MQVCALNYFCVDPDIAAKHAQCTSPSNCLPVSNQNTVQAVQGQDATHGNSVKKGRTVVFKGGVQVVKSVLQGPLASHPGLGPEAKHGQHPCARFQLALCVLRATCMAIKPISAVRLLEYHAENHSSMHYVSRSVVALNTYAHSSLSACSESQQHVACLECHTAGHPPVLAFLISAWRL